MVEQIADAAADQLQRAFGQNSGFDDVAEHQFRQIGGLARRLDDGGDAGEQAGRELLQHAPAGKVEGVDVDGDARQRRQDMLRGERAVARQALGLAFDEERLRRQFAPAARGIGEQHAEAAFDVDGAVGARRAGGEGELVEFLLALGQILPERLQHVGAGVEVERRAAPCRRARP